MTMIYEIPVPNEHTWQMIQGIIRRYDLNKQFYFPEMEYNRVRKEFSLRYIQMLSCPPYSVVGWRTYVPECYGFLNRRSEIITPAQLLRKIKEAHSAGCT